MKIRKNRRFCPEPPKQLPTKLKRYYGPIAVVLSVVLFAVPLSLFSFNYLFQPSVQHPPPLFPAPSFVNSTLSPDSNRISTVAQSFGNVTINADGSVSGTGIQRNGNIYTLTGDISGGISVQKSYVVIDGAGYTVNGGGQYVGVDLSNGRGQNPSRNQISNVTVRNLQIINCSYAIGNENTYNNTFIGNYISDSDMGFWITGSANNTLIHNTVKNCTTGISINYGSGGNIITENNVMSSWSVWLSPDPVVDRNYWGDYLTRFPNAKEIDNSGVWDTPYSHVDKVIDYHPLTDPVAVPSNDENKTTPTVAPTQIPTLPTQSQSSPMLDHGTPNNYNLFWVVLAAFIAAIIIAAAVLVFKRKKRRG